MNKSYTQLIRESNKSHDFDKGWIKFDGFLNKDIAEFLYGYILLSKRRLEVLNQEINLAEIHEHMYGTFNDGQAQGDSYSKYGDLIFDTLLLGKLRQLEQITNMRLVPQYSYYRLYAKGAELKEHKDRESCEISVSLCLGYDSHYNWPIWFEEKSGEKISIEMSPGDMVVYKGNELKHWREQFEGNNHAQVFLHYTNLDGSYGQQKFDTRNALGLFWKDEDQHLKEYIRGKNE